MQRVDEVVDVKNVSPDIEYLEDESEKRNTAKHHVRQIAEERGDKEAHFCSVFAHFFFRACFQPALERS